MQKFRELGVVHINVSDHDLLAKKDLEGPSLFELIGKIQYQRGEMIFIGPLD